MKKALEKDKLIFALIVALAFLIGNNAIYKTNLNKINSLKARIEEEKNKRDVLGMIAVLDKKLKGYQENSFSTAEITQVLDRISLLAEQAEITIETFNPLPREERKDYLELSLKLPISCDYHKLGEFFSLIENNPQLIRIKALNMQRASTREAAAPKVDLTVSGLYLK